MTDAVTILILNVTVLNNDEALETSERRLLLGVFLGNGLGTTNDFALVVPKLALSIGGDAGLGKLLCVTLGELTNNVSIAIDELARLVDGKTLKDGQRWKVVFRSILSILGGVFRGVLGIFSSILSILGVIGGILSLIDLLLDDLGKSLDLAKDVAVFINDLTLLVDLLAGALVDVALSKLADRLALFVEDLTLLVDLETLEDINVRYDFNLLDLGLDLAKTLLKFFLSFKGSLTSNNVDFSNGLALLVENLTLVVDGLAGAVLDFALDELTNLLALGI